MKNKYISDFKVGDKVEDIFFTKSKRVLNFRSKPGVYLSLVLSDKSGEIESKLWDFDPDKHDFSEKCIVKCKGEIVEFAGALELHIDSYEFIDDKEVDPLDFLPVTPLDIQKMQKEFADLVLSMSNSYLQKLLSNFMQDEELFGNFSMAPAAKVIHEAYIGGLLEHSLNTAKLTAAAAEFYPAVNKDLAIAGALLHDIGKMYEYEVGYSIEVGDEGRLLGHIILGLRVLETLTEKISDFPEDLKLALNHIITSHHGRYEWQAPKRPKTIEACLVHYADALEADLWKFSDLKETYKGQSWSPWQRSLERYVYLKK